MKARRIALDSMLAGIALTIFIVELQIPVPVPIPGVKLGLANIVTLFALFLLTPQDAAAVLIVRIFLGCMFSGRMITFFYSMAGGFLCLLVMMPLVRLLSVRRIWICSMAGAVAHNIGQILVAAAVTRSTAVFSYLPILVLTGMATGLFTGLCAYFMIEKIKPLWLKWLERSR